MYFGALRALNDQMRVDFEALLVLKRWTIKIGKTAKTERAERTRPEKLDTEEKPEWKDRTPAKEP